MFEDIKRLKKIILCPYFMDNIFVTDGNNMCKENNRSSLCRFSKNIDLMNADRMIRIINIDYDIFNSLFRKLTKNVNCKDPVIDDLICTINDHTRRMEEEVDQLHNYISNASLSR
ncbi:hypothetical protein D9V35_01710 [Commensalibacter melissae]|nr:hypothetical protein D9V35_01710 [Commensalibacter melissae]